MVPLMNLNLDPPSKVLLVGFAEVARSGAGALGVSKSSTQDRVMST
jgi:hypothetical protein